MRVRYRSESSNRGKVSAPGLRRTDLGKAAVSHPVSADTPPVRRRQIGWRRPPYQITVPALKVALFLRRMVPMRTLLARGRAGQGRAKEDRFATTFGAPQRHEFQNRSNTFWRVANALSRPILALPLFHQAPPWGSSADSAACGDRPAPHLGKPAAIVFDYRLAPLARTVTVDEHRMTLSTPSRTGIELCRIGKALSSSEAHEERPRFSQSLGAWNEDPDPGRAPRGAPGRVHWPPGNWAPPAAVGSFAQFPWHVSCSLAQLRKQLGLADAAGTLVPIAPVAAIPVAVRSAPPGTVVPLAPPRAIAPGTMQEKRQVAACELQLAWQSFAPHPVGRKPQPAAVSGVLVASDFRLLGLVIVDVCASRPPPSA
jgi:hypothetical protein